MRDETRTLARRDRNAVIGQWIGVSAGRLQAVDDPRRVKIDAVWNARGERASSVTIVRWRVAVDAPRRSPELLPAIGA